MKKIYIWKSITGWNFDKDIYLTFLRAPGFRITISFAENIKKNMDIFLQNLSKYLHIKDVMIFCAVMRIAIIIQNYLEFGRFSN